MEFFQKIHDKLFAKRPGGIRKILFSNSMDFYYLRRLFTISSRPRRHQMESMAIEAANRLEKAAPSGDPHLELAREVILTAVDFMDRLKTTRAMTTFHRFDEIMIDFDPEDDLRTRAIALTDEVSAPQFDEVRTAIANQLEGIDFDEEAKTSRNRSYLKKAIEIRNLHIEAQFIRKSMLRSLLVMLSVAIAFLGFAALLIVVCVARREGIDVSSVGFKELTHGLPKYLLAGIFGALGATFSAMMNFSSSKEVPDVFTSFAVTLVRPAIGAVSGIIAVLFLYSGIVNVTISAMPVFLVCFAFGFSERLVLGVISKADFRKSA